MAASHVGSGIAAWRVGAAGSMDGPRAGEVFWLHGSLPSFKSRFNSGRPLVEVGGVRPWFLQPRARSPLGAPFDDDGSSRTPHRIGRFVENGLPVVTADADRDAEALASDVIELEHQRVALSAVEARPIAEELNEIGHPLGDKRAFSTRGIRDIALAVGRVVLSFVLSPTRAAVVVPLAISLAVPGKVLRSLRLEASSASLRGVLWRAHRTYVPIRVGRRARPLGRRIPVATGSGAVW
jgi:hypothetical protein